MSSTLRQSNLIDNCTPSISYDRQVQSACSAFDQQMYEIIDETGQVIMIPSIMHLTDPKLVDILAWQFHVDFYDHARDLEFKKRLVQMSIIWHKTKGTRALVQEVLDTYWPGSATLQEWFEYMTTDPPVLVRTFLPSDVNPAQNRFNLVGHGLLNDQLICFTKGAPANTLPTPIIEGQFYAVVNALTNSFQISTDVGGAPVVITTSGTGSADNILKHVDGSLPPNYPSPGWHDRYRFRILLDEDIVDPNIEAQVVELIYRYKPVSRWPESTPIIRPRSSTGTVYVAGYAQIFITRESHGIERPPPT